MNLSMENRASTNAIPDSLLQTVGVMSNAFRSMDYVQTRLSDLMESTDLDPSLRNEMQYLRDATSEVRFRLSRMGSIITDLLKGVENGRGSDRNPCDAPSRGQGQTTRGCKRFEVTPAASR